MKRKLFMACAVLVILLVSIIGTAAAQSGTDPEVTPTSTPTTQPVRSKFYTHPVVQILSAYFGREKAAAATPAPTATATPVIPTEPNLEVTLDPSVTATPEPSVTPEPETPALTPEELAQQIAQYHEEGMGFGVLVKIYAMAEASAEDCADQNGAAQPEADQPAPTEPACTAVTVDELVEAMQSGTGMGQLFKEYGKPALLGVGHVKKELKKQADQPTQPVDEAPVLTETPPAGEATLQAEYKTQSQTKEHGNSGKPQKVKTPKVKGPKK